MPHSHTLTADRAALVVVDVQDAFGNAIADLPRLAQRMATMVRGARLLSVPVLLTEQAPAKLGRTVEPIRAALPADYRPLEKTCFSCCGAGGFLAHLEAADIKQVLLCGIETHICVNQTAHDLLHRGLQVHVLNDCVASRHLLDHQAGLDKMRQSGVIPSSVEMALFELMGDASHEQFRAVSKLIR